MIKFFIFYFLFFINFLFAQEVYTKEQIQKMISKMIILGFNKTHIDENDKIYKDIKSGLGGVILFDRDPNDKTKSKNIESKTQLKQLNNDLQSISNQKLLIAIDQEGGIVQRLKSQKGFIDTISAQDMSKQGMNFVQNSYMNLSKELNYLGINLNLAPVIDLGINENNKVVYQNKRTYGKTSSEVIKYAEIFINEMKKEKVFSSLKHFPGHGSSQDDSHHGFVDISKTWNENELEPYRYFIKKNNADFIMTAHVFNENLDNKYPATLSYNITTKLLRNELGFKGVIITDDLQMRAISKYYDLKSTVTLAINAGANILLFGNQLQKEISLKELVDVIYSQIQDNKIKLQNIIDSNNYIEEVLQSL